MRQRVMIAMALACSPDLLIADEPTTALDVTVEKQILRLLQSLRRDTGAAILMITHNLSLMAEHCDRVAVMYAGQIVEMADTATVFQSPMHPYTRALLGAMPRRHISEQRLVDTERRAAGHDPRAARLHLRAALSLAHRRMCGRRAAAHPARARPFRALRARQRAGVMTVAATTAAPHRLIEVDDLCKTYTLRRGVPLVGRKQVVRAVDHVTLDVRRGETLGLVGESGSGKSTLGRVILNLVPITSGSVRYEGRDLASASMEDMRRLRRRMQIIFQDPYSSLHPRMTVREAITEGLRAGGVRSRPRYRAVSPSCWARWGSGRITPRSTRTS